MRRSDERKQWEHTDEEEALYGFSRTGDADMPPSFAAELNEYADALEKARAELAAVRAERDEARRLLEECALSCICHLTAPEQCWNCRRVAFLDARRALTPAEAKPELGHVRAAEGSKIPPPITPGSPAPTCKPWCGKKLLGQDCPAEPGKCWRGIWGSHWCSKACSVAGRSLHPTPTGSPTPAKETP